MAMCPKGEGADDLPGQPLIEPEGAGARGLGQAT